MPQQWIKLESIVLRKMIRDSHTHTDTQLINHIYIYIYNTMNYDSVHKYLSSVVLYYDSQKIVAPNQLAI